VADSPRIADLRRRVQQDPASLAFAPLAEELRRAGQLDEAVRICLAGLEHHPEYTSARATLGRALLERGEIEPAFLELTTVLGAAPEHLGALRGVAEIHQRRGEVASALEKYRIALALVGREPELERLVGDLERQLAASAPAPPKGLDEPPPAVSPPPAAPDPRDLLVLDRLQRFLDAVLADRERRTGDVS
jgi:tetratricopeptide (TPR) repeat protein